MADAADAGDAGVQHPAAVAVGSSLVDISAHHHFRGLVDDAQICGIDVSNDAGAVHHANAVLHRLQYHLQPLLHEGVFVQQPVHLMDPLSAPLLEIALQKFPHGIRSLLQMLWRRIRGESLRRHKDLVP